MERIQSENQKSIDNDTSPIKELKDFINTKPNLTTKGSMVVEVETQLERKRNEMKERIQARKEALEK